MMLTYEYRGREEKVDLECENDDLLEMMNIYSKRILDQSVHCKAKKNYKSDLPELLNLKVNDYIFILDKSFKEKGWLQGGMY